MASVRSHPEEYRLDSRAAKINRILDAVRIIIADGGIIMKRLVAAVLALILAAPMMVTAFADWYCPQCGRKNDANFCPVDGTRRPSDLGGSTGTHTYTPPASAAPQVGSYVIYGRYEQDNDTSNGKEPIEWLVLDVQGNQTLLVSRRVLDGQQYDENSRNDVTWECSTLRSWLNYEFITKAFTADEASAIAYTIQPEGCVDSVFLLSRQEAETYWTRDADRLSVATPYATQKICHQINGLGENATCRWWLRTVGEDRHSGMYISHYDGIVYIKGFTKESYSDNFKDDKYNWVGVRPAMWVYTSAL